MYKSKGCIAIHITRLKTKHLSDLITVNNLTLLEYSKLCELVKSNKSIYIMFFPDTYKKSSLKEIELYHMYAVKFNEEYKYKKFYVLYENDWEEKINDIIGEIL